MNSSLSYKGRIGIITGAGPEAGIDLWQKILQKNKNNFEIDSYGDVDAPPVVVHSVPSMGLVMDIDKHEKFIERDLLNTLDMLDEQVDYFCIACNILHYYSDIIVSNNYKCEFVSIVDPIKKYISDNQIKKIALLSIGTVMELGSYSPYKILSQHVDIEITNSSEMNDLVKGIKSKGSNDKNLVSEYHDIINKLDSETVLLACTELPLLPTTGINKNIIDATDLLANELASRSYSARFSQY
ncbi:MAG: aspartate/glutamate racemase family protein [Thermodesulfobacteriota bacterium]